jgi:carbon monoxide dehydrogenase subunit G
MIKWEKSVLINRPQQEVWEFISDPATLSQWSSTAESAEWASEGPPGVGSNTREVGNVFGRRTESTSEVTVWDPPNKFGRTMVSGPFQGEATMKLEPKENGTQFTIYGQVELGGFFKIAQGLVGRQAEKQADADLKRLKQLLEEGQA